jgi:hypothetical protein
VVADVMEHDCALPPLRFRMVGSVHGCHCNELWVLVAEYHPDLPGGGHKYWRRLEMTQPDKPVRPTPEQVDALNDMVSLISEMVIGYRKRLIDGGIPADTADQLTTEFHSMVMEQTKEGVRQGAAQQARRR